MRPQTGAWRVYSALPLFNLLIPYYDAPMATVPDVVRQLVDKFRTNADHYTSPAYNETLCRVDFINPVFEALGWDMANRAGYADAYRDVIHEDAIKIGGATKAPDYCFRIGGTRKFFLEAKKPGVDLKSNPDPAYQLRRYAWSAKLPLSILTDFQEFAVYDCRVRPDKQDKASTARIFYCTCDEYLEQWDRIASIFARESVLKGSFDRYAEAARGKRGTAEVDAAFLKEIESWRDALARNLALRNELSQRDLNFAVQRIIDRIIFLRICEDRGIETYAQLQGLLNGPNVYARLQELFNRADERYNSGLFHFQREKDRHEAPDELTPGLNVDDKVLKDIIRSLYYPDSPYEFSVLPADILGQVYEQFLGKVIRLTAGHRAVVEEKPEVRKAGGVYYTPTYIVDYIVRNTVGKLLEGKTPQQVGGLTETFKPSKTQRSIAVLDPACGSGSFLIGAYQYLLDWYRDQYVKDDPKAHAIGRNPRLYQRSGGDWRLTTAERKRILLAHIYGVDIDSQAVETTKLSLLLKVLEGESGESLHNQLRLFHERALPDLGDNIKCGNSLIGPDFYDNQQMMLLDTEERLRVNVFDWNAEFAEIMKSGGFDAVIGNPPYVRQEAISDAKRYFEGHYRVYDGVADLYAYFVERGLAILRKSGFFGMIVSNKWLRAGYGEPLRRFLSTEASVQQVLDFAGLPVFAGATVRPVILICSPGHGAGPTVEYLAPLPLDVFRTISTGNRLQELFRSKRAMVPTTGLSPAGWSFSGSARRSLLEKIRSCSVALAAYTGRQPLFGVKTGLNEAFLIDGMTRSRLIAEDCQNAEIIKPVVGGRDIRRYAVNFKHMYLIFCRRGIEIKRYPAILAYLEQYRKELTPKKSRKDPVGRKPGQYEWYEIQDTVDYYEAFERPKIIFPDIATSCRFASDEAGYYGTNTTYVIPRRDPYLLGILNSRVAHFAFSEICAGLEGGSTTYLRFFGQHLSEFPIRAVDPSIASDKAAHDKIVSLVEQMPSLHTELSAARTGHEKDALQRQIDATDRQIDRLVYELYDLTEDEIAIVEGKT